MVWRASFALSPKPRSVIRSFVRAIVKATMSDMAMPMHAVVIIAAREIDLELRLFLISAKQYARLQPRHRATPKSLSAGGEVFAYGPAFQPQRGGFKPDRKPWLGLRAKG